MKEKLAALWAAFRLAFDSLVRTYSGSIIASTIGLLTSLGVKTTPEVKGFIGILVAFVFFVLWYLLNRLYEIISGKASKLLTLGIVKTTPAYPPSTKIEKAADAADKRTIRTAKRF